MNALNLSVSIAVASILVAVTATAAPPPTQDKDNNSTPFRTILSRLETNGSFLEVIDASTFEKDIRDAAEFFRKNLEVLYPELSAAERRKSGIAIGRVIDSLVGQGVLSVRGRGKSVVSRPNGSFSHRTFWYVPKGGRFLDIVATKEPAPTEFLPAGSVFAFASSSDLRALRDCVLATFRAADPASAGDFEESLAEMAEGGVDVMKLVDSIRPGLFFSVLADSSRPLHIPGFQNPLPGLSIVLGVRVDGGNLPEFALQSFRAAFEDGANVFPRTFADGIEGIVAIPFNDDVSASIRPTIAYDSVHGMLLVATMPDAIEKSLGAAAGDGRLAGIPSDGAGFVRLAPEASRIIASILESAEPDDFRLTLPESLSRSWFNGRCVRDPEGILFVSRASFGAQPTLRLLGIDPDPGVACIGLVSGMLFPAIKATETSAQNTRIANNGKQIAIAILCAIIDREANSKADIWPDPGKWRNSNEYFARLMGAGGRAELEGVSMSMFSGGGMDPAVDAEELQTSGNIWSCLAGIRSCDDNMPFIWSSNLVLSPNDFVSRDSEVDWSGKIDPTRPPYTDSVILVRKGCAFQVIKAKDLTNLTFLAGTGVEDPSKIQILEPVHYSFSSQKGHHNGTLENGDFDG